MALADKYTGGFNDFSGEAITIQIQQDGFAGEAEDLNLADMPLGIYVPSREVISEIYGLGCKINIRNTGALDKYHGLFATAQREHYVLIKKGSIKLFEGFILPQIYEQELMPDPEITIPANNQISGLKDYRTNILDVDNEFSIIYLMDLVKDILDSTGLKLLIYIKNTLFSKLYAATYNLAITCYDKLKVNRQIYIDQDEVMDGYSILEDILRITYSRLYYYDGKWIIDRLTDVQQTTGYKIYPFTGSPTTGTLTHPAFDLSDKQMIGDSGHLEYEAGMKECRLIIDFDKYDNLIDPVFNHIWHTGSIVTPQVGVWHTITGVKIVQKGYNSTNVTTGVYLDLTDIEVGARSYTSISTTFLIDVKDDLNFSVGMIYDDLKNVEGATWKGRYRLRYNIPGTSNWRVLEKDVDGKIVPENIYDLLYVPTSPFILTETTITSIAVESRILKVNDVVEMNDIKSTIESDLGSVDHIAFVIDIAGISRDDVVQVLQKIGNVTIQQNSGILNNIIEGTLNTDFRGVIEKTLRIYDGDFVNYKNTLLLTDSDSKTVRSRNWSDNNIDHVKKLQHILIHNISQQFNTARHAVKVDLWLRTDQGLAVSMGSLFTYSNELAGRTFIVVGYDFNVKMCTYRIYLAEHKDYDNFDIV